MSFCAFQRPPNIAYKIIGVLQHAQVSVFLDKVSMIFSLFLKKGFIYLFMTDTERDRHIGRGRSRISVVSLMQDSIPGPGDHALGKGSCSTTELPRCPMVLNV